MNRLENIIFNPATGMFEDKSEPTAHLTPTQIRQARRRERVTDPLRAEKKPVFVFVRSGNGDEHEAGKVVTLAWRVRKAQRVTLCWPNGDAQSFASDGSCSFIMPNHPISIKLLAENEGYKTQRTITINPSHKSTLQRAVEWIAQKIGH